MVSAAESTSPTPDQHTDIVSLKKLPLDSYTMTYPFLDSYFRNSNFEIGGDVSVLRSGSFPSVQLTRDENGQNGWMYSKSPLPSLTENDIEIEIAFKIGGAGQSLYGDGMAIWLTTTSSQDTHGSVFGGMDKFTGLAILIDTYKNNRPGLTFPYIMPMLGDGQSSYDNDHDGKQNELDFGVDGCGVRGLHNAHRVKNSQLRITSVHGKFISVDILYRNEDTWKTCFLISGEPLQRFYEVVGDKPLYLGLSAHTGDLSEYHSVGEVRVNSLSNAPGKYTYLAIANKVNEGQSRWDGYVDDDGEVYFPDEDEEEYEQEEEESAKQAPVANRGGNRERDNYHKLGYFAGSKKAHDKINRRNKRKAKLIAARNQRAKSTWVFKILQILMFVVFVVGAYAVVAIYRANNRSKRRNSSSLGF
ncbi:concanavalin A-like lectin/glucanase [Nadsonia fulvescens var. elongata DSM 6958]|uniref:Concanavalin A-like lectin/glucanase n=1 Tax=Nadsonia fulvescens var. elongata DSM 6958 TaxID=857566 RepID=A0A1E3PP96_9ASCO|nr:concanavalin A-like lectin/glucanase [Nadsonia fulvescens var. elongata DSM 6958]